MKNLFLFLLLTLGFNVAVIAQNTVTITGKVISSDDGQAVVGATVMLNAKDSTKLTSPGRVVLTDVNGVFTIRSREKQSDITIKFMGYKNYFKNIAPGKANVNLGNITLEQESVGIEAAVVTAQSKISTIKEDTVQFNAVAFKTNPDATAEDLVKKMPGVTVGTDGSINNQGEKVTKVLVNGKEYFDSDPSAALKNLPSDAIESVQMYDGQSDQAKFSGMDDGERIKTINIVTKRGFMSALTGRIWAGYGTDGRYTSGASLNFGNDNHRFGIMAGSNNVNNQGFTLDMGSGMRGGRGIMRAEGVSTGSFQTNARGGINQSSNFGINYNGTFADKLKLNLEYSFGNINGWQKSFTTSDMISSTRPYYSESASEAKSFDNSHRFVSRVEWTPTAKNRINFNTRINYGVNRGPSSSSTIQYTELDGAVTSASVNSYLRRYENYDLSGDLWWQRALNKPGRTLSLGLMVNAQKGMGKNEQHSLYGLLSANNKLDTSFINRIGALDMSGYSLTGSFTYNEPLSKSSRLSANYNINYNRTIADQAGFKWDELDRQYSLIDTSTTNYLSRNYTTHTMGLGYTLTQGKTLTFNIGLDYLLAAQNNDQYRPAIGQYNNKFYFTAWQPSIRMRYTPAKGQNLMLFARRSSGFPSIAQMQDVLDVTDPINVSKGNPNLQQSYSNMLMFRYSLQTEKNHSFSLMLMGNLRENSIVTNRYRLNADTVINGTTIHKNSTYSTYTNMNGAMSLSTEATYTFPISFIKSTLATTVNYSYSRQPSMQDGLENLNNNNVLRLNLSLNSNISQNVDFRISYSPTLNFSSNTIGQTKFNRYIAHSLSGFANVFLTRNLYVNADGTWYNNYGTAQGASQHNFILNAAIGFKFLKNREAEFKVQAYDLFNQSRSLVQSIDASGNIITNMNYSLLQRYFMVSFMYKFGTPKSQNNANSERRMMYGGGGMMPPH